MMHGQRNIELSWLITLRKGGGEGVKNSTMGFRDLKI